MQHCDITTSHVLHAEHELHIPVLSLLVQLLARRQRPASWGVMAVQ